MSKVIRGNAYPTFRMISIPCMLLALTLYIFPVILSDRFWFRLSARVCGEARFLCCSCLLACALAAPWTRAPFGDSPLQTRFLVRRGYPSEFVDPQGIMKGLTWFYSDGPHLDIYHWSLCISWLMTIFGK